MPTIDDRVVQMTFKNSQFEHGVKESLNSLQELKKALDLDKSAESLSNLEKIAGSFDISGIAKGIDSIADRFSLVGNIGQEIFHRISRTAVDAMQNVVNTITSMPRAGLSKYEQKNKAIQMIQSAMPEKSIEEIEGVLARLNEYTDLTSYDFSTMSNSIGKFVSAGVDLETAETVMEGIANEAASAGGDIQQANVAMYNFSQALAAGSVKLLDWRSIQNQNLDTKEFKEQIIQTAIAMGTLGKVSDNVGYIMKGTGKNAKKVLVDYKSFAETLSTGWFTSDVMIKVFEKYADRESDVGKKGFEAAKVAITLSQAFEAVKDAISTGWMKSFSYLFGNLEEASDLFTRISDALIDFSDQVSGFRNRILEGWHTGGEDGISGYRKAIDALSNSWSVLMGIVEAAKGAFSDVFGVIDSSGFIEATKSVADFTEKLKNLFGYSEETVTKKKRTVERVADVLEPLTQSLTKGMESDEVKTLQERLLKLGNSMIRLDKYGADGIFGPETQAAVKAFQKSVGLAETGIYDQATHAAMNKALYPNGKLVRGVEEYEETVTHMGTGLEQIQKSLRGVFSVLKAGLSIVTFGLDLAGRAIALLAPVGLGLLNLAAGIGDVITYVVDFASALTNNDAALRAFNAILTPLSAGLKAVGDFLTGIGDGLTRIAAVAREATSFDELGKMLSLDPETNKNALAIYNVLTKIRDIAAKAAPVFEGLKDSVVGFFNAAREWVSGKLSSGLDALSAFFTNLWNEAEKADIAGKVLSGIGTALQVIVGVIGGIGYGIFALGSALVNGAKQLYEFVKNSEFLKNIMSALSKYTTPVKQFFESVGMSISSVSKRLGSFKTFSQVWTAFMEHMRRNPIGRQFVPALKKIGEVIVKPVNGIKAFLEAVKTAFSALSKFKSPENALQELMKDPEKNKGAINILNFLNNVISLIGKAKTAIGTVKNAAGGLISKILPILKEFGGAVKEAVGNFFGGDGVSPGEKIGSGFEALKTRIAELFKKLAAWFNTFAQNSPFLSGLKEFGVLVRDAIVNFFGSDTSGIEGVAAKLKERLKAFDPIIDWIKEKLGNVKAFFSDPKNLLSHVAGFFGSVAKAIAGIFSKVDLGTMWDSAKVAFGMYVMYNIAKALRGFSDAAGVLTGAVDKKNGGIVEKLRSIAITIAIVTAAIAALAFIPADQALAGVSVMSFALFAISAAIIGISHLATKDFGEKAKDFGTGMLSMALSIGAVLLAIWGATKLLSGTDPGLLSKSLLFVGGIFAALAIVATIMSRVGKKGGGTTGAAAVMLAICAGLSLIVGAIGKIAKVIRDYPNNFDKAFWHVEILIGSLGAVAVLMAALGKGVSGNSSASGIATAILAMTSSLGTIVRSIGSLAKMLKSDESSTTDAFALVEVLLITVGTIAVILAKSTQDVGFWTSMASAAPIVAMGYLINQIATTTSDAIAKIANVDPWVVAAFMVGVDAALIATAAAIKIMSAIPVTGSLKAAISIIAVLGAIGLGLDIAATFTADAMDKLSSAMTLVGWRLSEFSDSIANVDEAKIKTVMDTMTTVVLPAIADISLTTPIVNDALETSKKIWMFGTALGLFRNSISGITVDTGAGIKQLASDIQTTVNGINAVEGIDEAKDVLTNLGGALALYYGDLRKAMAETGEESGGDTGEFDITKANEAFQNLADLTLSDETIAKIKSYATGGSNDLNNFSIGIENLGTALKDYGENISGIDAGKVKTANDVLDKATDIESHLNQATYIDFTMFKGKRKTITDFGLDIAALGGALAKYGESVATLNPARIIMGNVVMDAVASLNEILPKTGGLWQMLVGEQKLGDFAVNMSDLGSGMASYANSISSADFTNVQASMEPLRAMAEAQSILQATGGLAGLVAGSADIGQLAKGLPDFGRDLATFATNTDGIKRLKDADFTKIAQAIEPIKLLAEAQSKLQRQGGWGEFLTGSANLGKLGEGLNEFAPYLKTFSDSAKEFDATDEHLLNAISLIERIVAMQQVLQDSESYGMEFRHLGLGFSQLFGWIEDLLTSYGGDQSLAEVAETGFGAIVAGMAAAIENDTKTVEAMNGLLTDVSSEFNNHAADFDAVGRNIDAGLVNGMNNGESRALVVATATAVAMSAYNAALEALGIRSPSKAFAWIGEMTVEGFANGLTDHRIMVQNAISNIAGVALTTMKNKLGIRSPSSVFEWLGEMTDTGFANGLLGNLGLVDEATGSLSETATDGIKSALKGVFESLTGDLGEAPVISPVLDLTNVSEGAEQISSLLGGQSVSGTVDLAKNISSGNGVTIMQGVQMEDHSSEIIARIDALNGNITSLASAFTNLRVVMNTNALVGQLAGPLDRVLGGYSNRRG